MLISTSNNISTRTYQTGDIMNTNITSRLIPGIGRHPFPAYRGRDKYIFVSYAHKDKDIVFPEIARYQYMKYNVWYDEGISPGNEWKEDIAEHLTNSDLFIIFLTENTVKSKNCRKEFYCALNNNKNIIPFYLEDFDELPIDSDWKEDLSEIQGILMTTLDEEEYVFKFTEAFQKFGFNYGGIEIPQDKFQFLSNELDYDVSWQFARIFISSGFVDFHAERDYLIKEVFPELNEWGRRHRIIFTPIDLRWGITEDVAPDSIFEKEFLIIDSCRPFFISFLGQRRGWVPDFNFDIGTETIQRYAGILDYEGRSATEMEIEHALLRPCHDSILNKDNPPAKYCLFFIRDKSFLKDITDAQKMIYTNYELAAVEKGEFDDLSDESKRIIEESDYASQDIVDEVIMKKRMEDHLPDDDNDKVRIEITKYAGDWDENKEIPEIKALMGIADGQLVPRFVNDEWKGRLTNFKEIEENFEDVSLINESEDIKSGIGRSLKEVIIQQLKDASSREFPNNATLKNKRFDSVIHVELSDYHDYQNEFPIEFSMNDLNLEADHCYLNAQNYIEFGEYEEKLNDYIESEDEKICLVTADEGYGKTTILSHLSHFLKGSDEYNVYARFCGVSESSSDIYSLWTSIIIEAMIKNNQMRFYSYPLNYYDLFINFNNILNELSSYGKTVIVIDGAERLDRILELLKMIEIVPKNLKIILSIENNADDDKFTYEMSRLKNSENIFSIELGGLDCDDDKKTFIKSYLKSYLKELSYSDMDTICAFIGSENPLYLKILLSELIKFGSFDKLPDKIRMFGISPKDAFREVLERLESDYGEIARTIFFLFEINFTLSPDYIANKLVKMMNIPEDESKKAVKSILRELDSFVRVTEEGCIFLNESLKEAIREKYG